MNLDWLLAPQYLNWLWHGFLLTLWLSACAGLAATLLGFVLAAMRDSSLRPLRWLAMGYSSLFRNTPLLVQLFFWYFAAGQILPSAAMQWLNSAHQVGPLEWPSFEFLAGFFGLTLYSTAFIAEEIRSGIRGVAGGQKYAAQALGLTGWQAMRYVVLPQALKIALPPLLAAVLGFFRAIPVIMLIFWTYFLLPMVFGVEIPEITTVVCALALIASAYLAHAVKAGIAAIGPGQWQAGLSLGLTRWQTLRMIVLPQALRMMVPSFINQWISLIKDTSLAYIVGVGELTFLATQVNNRSMVYPMEVFLFVALVYFVFCLALDLLANAVNRRFGAQTRALKRSWRWWRNKPPLPAS
ncbi:TPA: ABC transporter permease subunit [Serratia marcescens]